MMETFQLEMYANYQMLDEYLKRHMINVNYSNNVNVIVDFKECLRKIFRFGEFDDLDLDEYKETTVSEIINIIGHYRNYFSKHLKYTTFYFIFNGTESEKMQQIFKDYKKAWYNKYLNSPVISQLVSITTSMCKTLVNGLPHCNWLDVSDYNEYIYTKCLIQNHPNDLNIILSNDTTLLPLLDSNVVMFDCKGLNTHLITHENAVKILSKDKYNFSNKLIPLVLSITGYDKYSIDGIKLHSYGKACKIISTLLNNNILAETEYYSVNWSAYQNKVLDANLEILNRNFKIFQPSELLFEAYSKILMLCVNTSTVVSYSELLDLNTAFFPTHPLDLSKILLGEDVIPHN